MSISMQSIAFLAVRFIVLAALLLGFGTANGAFAETAKGEPPAEQGETRSLVRLAAPGPWPAISALVAFDGAIWFANGDPLMPLNAADIYRYDPATGIARHERGLFTQGVGRPAIHMGRLYWPFADPRSNAALGEFAVTDGTNWQWHIMSDAISLKTSAMQSCGGSLLAAGSGWEVALQASRNGFKDWREIYRIPGAKAGEGRISALAMVGERCVFAVNGSGAADAGIYEWTPEGARPLPGWPDGTGASDLAAFNGGLAALDDRGETPVLWFHDGKHAKRLSLPGEGRLQSIAATPHGLIGLTTDSQGGALWSSGDGREWKRLQGFLGETPVDLLSVGEDIYVGTRIAGGRGVLWGPKAATVPRPGDPAAPLPKPEHTPISEQALEASLRTLEPTLSMKSDYMTFRSGLFNIALPVAMTREYTVGFFLAKRARRALPGGEMTTFTNHVYSNEQLARWLLVYMAAVNGYGQVPVEWLALPWSAKPRDTEKYFETLVLAIWAAARFEQKDVATIEALMALLDRAGDPNWIRGDAVASLTVLTGQHFGYDAPAWRAWWQGARATWAQPKPN